MTIKGLLGRPAVAGRSPRLPAATTAVLVHVGCSEVAISTGWAISLKRCIPPSYRTAAAAACIRADKRVSMSCKGAVNLT